MKAARIHQFGPPIVIVIDDIPQPTPGAGEVLVRVRAAGVGPWDAWIREGRSVVHPPLPLTLGSDLSGVIEEIGPGVSGFTNGDQVYGVTNPQFCGACAEFAIASANMLGAKPHGLSDVEASSIPVVAVTAWQMLFDYGQVISGQRVLVHGAAGNVGAYAVQLAKQAGARVIATASRRDLDYVGRLGAETVVDYLAGRFENEVGVVDVVIDTVGGETRERSFPVLKKGGILVSAVSPIPKETEHRYGIRAVFFLVEVTTARLKALRELFEAGRLSPQVGTILPLDGVRVAHEMLAGAPHERGKIVLNIAV